jgi:short-subunit dehydrogenase
MKATDGSTSTGKTAKICLVTGASSGIGFATVMELIQAGHIVYCAARRAQKMEPLHAAGGHVLRMDVTSADDLERVVDTVLVERQRIDVLVNNAGIGLSGAIEDLPIGQARVLFEVNLFGPARLIQLVLPAMRAQGSGRIINVSSMGGEIAFPLGAWYYASKHGLEAYSDTLRQEVGRFGIDVVLIQPGLIKTEFDKWTVVELRNVSGHGAYGKVAEAMANQTEKMFYSDSGASDPAIVAKVIRRAIESPAPKPRYAVGRMAKLLLTLNRFLPDRLFDWFATSRFK